MEHHPLNVLLLGWDEAAQAAVPPALDLSRHLAEHTPVSVIVPRLPAAATLTAADQVIRLNLLSAEQLATRALSRPAALAESWQAPAAPYAGSADPAPAAAGEPASAEARPVPASAIVSPSPTPAAAVLASVAALAAAPSPAPDLLNADAFAEATAEIGAEEAADLQQPENDLTLDAPEAEIAAPAQAPGQPAVATPASRQAAAQTSVVQALASLDNPDDGADLNFRVIQYARFATPLAVSQPFGVVYAAAWPAWLAALEIRQLTGRPLVLHVQSMAADRNTPDDRGWILELERLAVRRADLVLAQTEELAQRLVSTYSLPAARLRVIPADDTAAINEALSTVTPRS